MGFNALNEQVTSFSSPHVTDRREGKNAPLSVLEGPICVEIWVNEFLCGRGRNPICDRYLSRPHRYKIPRISFEFSNSTSLAVTNQPTENSLVVRTDHQVNYSPLLSCYDAEHTWILKSWGLPGRSIQIYASWTSHTMQGRESNSSWMQRIHNRGGKASRGYLVFLRTYTY